jgi:hypothetical protein
MSEVKQFDSFSTSYVNLAALLRYLREQRFVGSIHFRLDHYEAEVSMNGSDEPSVSEINPTTREASQKAGALERLLVHAREPGGTITVYDQEAKDRPAETPSFTAPDPDLESELFSQTPAVPTVSEVDWSDLLDASGKLIGAVERAVQGSGANFESLFRAARIELGDDYPFLDPTENTLTYGARRVTLNPQPGSNSFVTALSECLRRVVNKIAIGKDSKRLRESVAIELAVAARLHPTGLSEFKPQLDRIAGTRVL